MEEGQMKEGQIKEGQMKEGQMKKGQMNRRSSDRRSDGGRSSDRRSNVRGSCDIDPSPLKGHRNHPIRQIVDLHFGNVYFQQFFTGTSKWRQHLNCLPISKKKSILMSVHINLQKSEDPPRYSLPLFKAWL